MLYSKRHLRCSEDIVQPISKIFKCNLEVITNKSMFFQHLDVSILIDKELQGCRTQQKQDREHLLHTDHTSQETEWQDEDTCKWNWKLSSREKLSRASYESCTAMTRHAPTEQKGGDLKGGAYKRLIGSKMKLNREDSMIIRGGS